MVYYNRTAAVVFFSALLLSGAFACLFLGGAKVRETQKDPKGAAEGYALLSLGSVAVFAAAIVVCCCCCCGGGRGASERAAATERKTERTTEEIPGRLEVVVHGDACCCICLEPLQPDKEAAEEGPPRPLGRIKCGHVFHVRCICAWAVLKNSCPLCMQPLGGSAP